MGADTPARWDARQRALLEAMGVVVWTPSAAALAAGEAPAAPQTVPQPAPAPAPVRAAAPPRPAARPESA
ncbi:uracil-DNA glycosylase, partial [Ideonella sp. 4Y11]|nr:uracil-DNA glycosylase [Ideonella aquatica]